MLAPHELNFTNVSALAVEDDTGGKRRAAALFELGYRGYAALLGHQSLHQHKRAGRGRNGAWDEAPT